jgi:SAM-dependent methyltransferase
MPIYSEPRNITDLQECYFYHTVELPGIGRVDGNWDLRPKLKEYLGNVDFRKKRVLDVGCASGILSFYIEKQGAEVVSFDLDKNGDWDMVPFAKWEQFAQVVADRKAIIDRLNNAYWLAHRLLDSKAKVVYGGVYAIPAEIGPVDIAVYGSILLHLRDPFLALQNGLRLTTESVIVSEVLRGQSQKTVEPYLELLPDAKTIEPKDAWWDIRPEWIVRAIGVLGFENVKINYHSQRYEGRNIELYTVVGKRTHGNVSAKLV